MKGGISMVGLSRSFSVTSWTQSSATRATISREKLRSLRRVEKIGVPALHSTGAQEARESNDRHANISAEAGRGRLTSRKYAIAARQVASPGACERAASNSWIARNVSPFAAYTRPRFMNGK